MPSRGSSLYGSKEPTYQGKGAPVSGHGCILAWFPAPWFPGSWPYLAEWGPLVLTLGTEVLTEVCICEKHPHGAEPVEQP